MPYEEIQGEVVTMSDNLEAGFSGESTDWNGALLNSQDEDAWGTFRNHYWSCVTVG